MNPASIVFGVGLAASMLWLGCGGVAESDSNPAPGTGGSAGSAAGAGGGNVSGAGGQAGTGGQPSGGSAGAGGSAAAGGDAGVADASYDVIESGPADAPTDVDQITAFVYQMNGIWLVGWGGGMNHYSWVRITSDQPGSWGGKADFLAGDDLVANAPYWPCSGQGTWNIPAKPYSIIFMFPSSCPSGLEFEYTFDPFTTPSGYPKGAILAATVTPLSGGSPIEGYKFPDSQCAADMSSCVDPLK